MQVLLTSTQLNLTINRLAQQLVEDKASLADTVFIALQPRGVFIGDAIVRQLATLTNDEVHYGKLDITFYRDDVRNELHHPNKTEIPFSVDRKNVVLIDDVLYTGRTIRAALDALMDFGRPKSVKLCVLVNRRFERELPIQPDYFGIAINTLQQQKVKVVQETNEVVVYY